jgi:pimeloyl-ACP methyl ester carboxylesterase
MKLVASTLLALAGARRVVETERLKHNFTDADYEWHGTGSPFETWAQSIDTPDCPARIRRSMCGNNQYRGIAVFIHGFSACSEQAESVSEQLARQCVDVLAPTMPGHGRAPVWCGDGGSSCDVACGNGMGWTHDGLPTHRSTYDTFTRDLHRTISQELNSRAGQTGKPAEQLEVSLIGLSFGAPVALDLALMGGARHYARMLLVNPYLALGDETIDQAKLDCQNAGRSPEECEREALMAWLAPAGLDPDSGIARYLGDSTGEVVRSLFSNLAKLSDAVGESYQGRVENSEGTVAGLMQAEREWGAVCNQIWTEGRGGFCKFRNKHYLSTHSYGLHAVVDAQQWGAWSWGLPVTQIMTTERDGKTRNGLTYDLAQHLHQVDSRKVSMCMHKFQQGVDRSDAGQYWNDANSMPHANLKGTRAGGRWWESHLFDNVRQFTLGERTSISEPVRRNKDRNVCEDVALESGMEQRREVLDLVDVGVAPTRASELWPGLVFSALGLTR